MSFLGTLHCLVLAYDRRTAFTESARAMVNSNPFMWLSLATSPLGAAVLEVAGAEDGVVALVTLRTEDTTDFVAERLDVVTVVLAPTTGVGSTETGGTGDAELGPAPGYGFNPPVGTGVIGAPGTGVTGAFGPGVAEPAGIGVVWTSGEVSGPAGTGAVGAVQYSGVAVTVTVTIDSIGTGRSRELQ